MGPGMSCRLVGLSTAALNGREVVTLSALATDCRVAVRVLPVFDAVFPNLVVAQQKDIRVKPESLLLGKTMPTT